MSVEVRSVVLARVVARPLALLGVWAALAAACDDNTSGAEDLTGASQVGAAGASGAGGAAGLAGAPALLEPPAYCSPCIQAECKAELDACNAEAPCRALFSCWQACGTDLTCYLACEGSHPLGSRRAGQLRDCLDHRPCSGCIRWEHGLPSSDCDKCRDTSCWSEYGDAQASRDYWQFVDCWDVCQMGLSCFIGCKKQYPTGFGLMDRWTTCLAAKCKGC